MSRPRHLVTVWNPSYATDALEAHLSVLLRHAGACDAAANGEDDDVYVWWGKIRSPNRQAPLDVADIIALGRAMEAVAEDDPPETHLYVTDYQSLYVGDVDHITTTDVRVHDAAHVPEYYLGERRHCDAWFRLRDIRRLVSHDMHGVIAELGALRNVRYADRPVSLYGGMVDLPLLVTRPDGRRYFEEGERDALADGRLWAEFDAQRGGGVGEMERELRENHFGDELWRALDPAARSFLATAERAFRDHRGDAAFDFAQVMGSYAKAMEVQVNLLLRRGLAGAPLAARQANVAGRTEDLGAYGHLTMGALAHAIGGERALNEHLRQRLRNGTWFTASLPAILDDFARSVRNPGTHQSRVDRETAKAWRARLIGVGCAGDLVELARVCVRDSTS